MSTKTMTATIDKEFQGWFSYTSSSYDKNNNISLSFSAPSGVDVNNITISSAKLYITCSSSGKAAKKDFKITYGGTGTTAEIRSNGTAYGRETSITLTNSHVLSWLKGGTLTLTSADPSYTTSRSASSGGWYSENYVKISKAYIVLEYSVNAASISTYSKTMNFGSEYSVGWSSVSTSYLYSLTLTSGSYTQNIVTQKNYTTTSPQIAITPDAETFSTLLTNNPSKTSFSATLTLETFNSSKTSLGKKSVSVTLNTTSSVFKPTVSITITPSKTYESKNLANHTTFKFEATTSVNYGNKDNLKYLWTFPDGTTSTKPTVSSKIFSSAYTDGKVNLTVTDERNYSSGVSKKITIVAYSKPQITKFTPYRTNSVDDTKNIDTGVYVYVGSNARKATYTSTVGGVANSIKWSFTLDDKTTTTNSNNIITSHTVSADKTASVKATIIDTVGNTDTETVTLPSANYLLHFLKGTNSVGIGCAAVKLDKGQTGKITLGWPTKFNGKVTFSGSNGALSFSEGGTEATSRSGAWEKIVKEGGTITGELTTGILNVSSTLNVKNHSYSSRLSFSPSKQFNEYTGEIRYTVSENYNKGRFYFHQRSLNADGSGFSGEGEGAERYYLPIVDNGLTNIAEYNIFTTKNYCYYPSNTITLTSGWGYVSAGGKSVEVWFPVAKYLDKVSSATVTLMKGNFRAGRTYWVTDSYVEGGHTFTNLVT